MRLASNTTQSNFNRGIVSQFVARIQHFEALSSLYEEREIVMARSQVSPLVVECGSVKMRRMLHILLHFLLPAAIASLFFPKQRFKVWLILCATMLVDLDHLLADPIYDPNRCSINFHPLHSYWAIGIYGLLLVPAKTRLVAIGLLVHMLLDWQDCHFKITFTGIWHGLSGIWQSSFDF